MPQRDLGLLQHSDLIQPFLLHRSTVRGRMVRLGDVLDTIVTRHDNPLPVARLLGEMVTLAAMLSAQLPEKGILTLQARGDGPLRLLVADALHGGQLRGYAELAENGRVEIDSLYENEHHPSVPQLMGTGYLAITLDTGFGKPYQGIVPLEGANLTEAVVHYFTQSQQLDAMLRVFVARRIGEDGIGKWASAGLMLERIPDEGGHQPVFTDDGKTVRLDVPHATPADAGGDETLAGWDYNSLLAGTADEEEMLDPHLAPSALLYRLFNEGGVWVQDTMPLSAECRCSRARIEAVLNTMDAGSIEDMKIDGVITVTCQFCNTSEVFRDGDLSETPGRSA